MDLDKKLDNPSQVVGISSKGCPDVRYDGKIYTIIYGDETTKVTCDKGTNNFFCFCKRRCLQNIAKYCRG